MTIQMELMQERRTNELHDRLLDAGYAREVRLIDYAIQSALEDACAEAGRTFSLDSEKAWHEVMPYALEVLGVEYDDIVEVAA